MNADDVQTNMDKVLEQVSTDLASLRTGRVTASLVDSIKVPAYGGAQNLMVKELASITPQDAHTLIIDPWDKSITGDIRKGILTADVGLNPIVDGEILRISVPQMTGEDRQKHVKTLSTKIENGKIMIRKTRADAMKDIKNAYDKKEIPEDQKFGQEKKLQEMTDEFTEKIDVLKKAKEQEILTL